LVQVTIIIFKLVSKQKDNKILIIKKAEKLKHLFAFLFPSYFQPI